MPLSTFTGIILIPENSQATPGLWNKIFSTISTNLDQLNTDVTAIAILSTNTLQALSGNTISAGTYGLASSELDSTLVVVNTLTPHSGNTITDTGAFSTNTIVSSAATLHMYAFPQVQPLGPVILSFDTHRTSSFNTGDGTAGGSLQVYSQIVSTASGAADLVLLSPTPNFDIHLGTVAGGTGAVFIDTNIKVSDYFRSPARGTGLQVLQQNNAPVMEFPISSGLIDVYGRLRGQNSSGSNFIARIGGTSGNIIFESSGGGSNLWVMANDGTITQLGRIRSIDGVLGNPMYAFTADAQLGWYRSTTSTMALSGGTLDLTTVVTSIASLKVKSGANNSCGSAVLGSNGSVNVANTYVAAGDLIFLTDQTPGGTLGDLELGGIRAGSGFTIQSTSVTDTSTVGWLIVRPT